jgi:hypothetical protein
MTVTSNLAGLMVWSFIPSNVAGRTKKSVTTTLMFVACEFYESHVFLVTLRQVVGRDRTRLTADLT